METKELINPKHDLSNPDLDLSNFSDKDLYNLCQQYGAGIRMLRRIFAVLLVEVNRRRLHRKYGFEGIYEFASKVGGMEKKLVDRILWLADFLKDKPFLWREFRREGWSKVRVVASVATKETDEIWAEKVNLLSKPALEEFVKYWRKNLAPNVLKQLCKNKSEENLFNFTNDVKSEDTQSSDPKSVPKNSDENQDIALSKPETSVVPEFGDTNSRQNGTGNYDGPSGQVFPLNGEPFVKMRFKVSQETEFRFLIFKQKLCKKKKEALTSGEVLTALLDDVEE